MLSTERCGGGGGRELYWERERERERETIVVAFKKEIETGRQDANLCLS